MWYVNIWRRLTLINSGCCPSGMEKSYLVWKNTIQRTGGSKHIFPGITALLVEMPTALQHSTRVLFLQQMRAQQRQGELGQSPVLSTVEAAP